MAERREMHVEQLLMRNDQPEEMQDDITTPLLEEVLGWATTGATQEMESLRCEESLGTPMDDEYE